MVTTTGTETVKGDTPGASLMVKSIPSIQSGQDSLSDVTYFCGRCPYKTQNKANIDRHIDVHPEKAPKNSRKKQDKCLKCHLCKSRFNFQRTLTLHMKNVHSVKMPFQCDQCPYSCSTGYQLRDHFKNKHPVAANEQTTLESAIERTLSMHKKKKKLKKQYKCNICGDNASMSSYHLKLHHMRVHAGEKPLKCQLCPYRCVAKATLQEHMITRHTGGEKYKCDRCLFETSRSDELGKHLVSTHLSKARYNQTGSST